MTVTEPIFILSAPRAGSTLLRYMLDAHPSICCSAELRVGAVCEYLETMVETLFRGDDSERSTARQLSFVRVRGILDEIVAEYCERSGKRRWCEKTPANLDSLGVLHATFPDGRYLCLHRHGLDVVHSVLESSAMRAHVARFMPRHSGDAVAAAVEWSTDRAERVLGFANTWPDSSLNVNYEDLVAQPDATLARICEFVGVEKVPALAQQALSGQHGVGRGDYKIVGQKSIRTDGVGRGLSMDVSRVPLQLIERMLAVLDRTGYAAQV